MSPIGCVGAAAFALAWIPQCAQTWRERRCDVNGWFLALSAVGSVSLALHALSTGDLVFLAVNALTSAGAILNIAVKAAQTRNARFGRSVATPELSRYGGETKRP